MTDKDLDMLCAFIRTRYSDPGRPEFEVVVLDKGKFLDSVRLALDPICSRPKTDVEKLQDEVYLLRGKVNDMEMRLRGRP